MYSLSFLCFILIFFKTRIAVPLQMPIIEHFKKLSCWDFSLFSCGVLQDSCQAKSTYIYLIQMRMRILKLIFG